MKRNACSESLLLYVGQDSVVVGDFVVAHQGAVEGSVLA